MPSQHRNFGRNNYETFLLLTTWSFCHQLTSVRLENCINERGCVMRAWLEIRRTIRWAAGAAALALIATTAAPIPVSYAAPNDLSPVTSFQLDGDIVGPNDWGDPLGSAFYGAGTTPGGNRTAGIVSSTTATDSCTNDGTGYPGSQKINTNPWSPGAASPNKKDDLCKGMAAIEVVEVAGQYEYIYYLLWTRRPDSTGDMSGYLPLEGPQPGRADDKIVEFNYAPSSDSMAVNVLSWNTTSNTWVSAGTLTDDQFGFAVGRNTSAATGGVATANPATLIEFAVNLTSTGILGEDSCQTFSSASGISRTGNGTSAELQDFLPYDQALTIRSCGNLTISKQTIPANALGGPFAYSITQATLPAGSTIHDSGLRGDADETGEPDTDYTEISGSLTVDTDTTDTWQGLLGAPDYQITETDLPDGWAIEDIRCTYKDIFTGQTVTESIYPSGSFQIPSATLAPEGASCVIINTTSTITIAKDGAGNGDDQFDFAMTGKPDQSLTLGDKTAPITYTPGSNVTITETLPNVSPSWVGYGATCVNDTTGQVVATSDGNDPLNVTTVGGHNITCTFVNQQQARIQVSKRIPGVSDTFDFTWSANPGGTETLGHDQSSGWIEVDPNTGLVNGAVAGPSYSVSEAASPGYSLGAIVCNESTQDSTVDVANRTATYSVSPGESVNCQFVNVPNGSVTIVKDGQPNSPQDFTFTGAGAGIQPAMAAFQLDDDNDPTLDNTITFSGVVPGSYTITEQSTAGWDLTNLVCTDQVGNNTTVDLSSATAALQVDADDTIVCVFTNTRKTAQLTLTKNWENAFTGDQVILSTRQTLDGVTGARLNGSSVATGPASSTGVTTDAVRTIYSDSTVELWEEFVVGDAHYNVSLQCTDANGLTYTPGELTGTYAVPTNPVDVTCTITNTHKTATIALVKDWGNSPAQGEQADLSAGSYLGSGSDTNTNDNDATTPGRVEIAAGLFHGANLSEAFVDVPASRYSTSLRCDGGTLDYSDGQLFGSITLDETDENQTITCTFVNQRYQAALTLLKVWGYGAPADSAGLYLNATNSGASTSTVPALPTDMSTYNPTFFDFANTFTEVVYGGEQVEMGETLPAQNVGSYTSSITCRDERQTVKMTFNGPVANFNVPDNIPSWGVDADTDGAIEFTCIVANSRVASTINLQKTWIDAIAGDTADLTALTWDVPDSDTKTSTADGALGSYTSTWDPELDILSLPAEDDVFGYPLYNNVASIHALSGSKAYLNEAVSSTGTTYLSGAPVCTYLDEQGQTATATITEHTAADAATTGQTDTAHDYLVDIPGTGTDLTCTYTNEAPRGTIMIVKNVAGTDSTFTFNQDWQDPAGAFSLTTVNGTASTTFENVLAGSYTVSEDRTAVFDFTSLSCIDPDGGTVTDGLTGTIDLDDGEVVVCTYTNTEKATLVVSKDARPGSAQPFSFTVAGSSGVQVPSELADFQLDDGPTGPLPNAASALVQANGTYTITENPTSGWTLNTAASFCTDGSRDGVGDLVAYAVASDGTVDVTPAPGTTMVCYYVNDVIPASLTLTKTATGTPSDYGWQFAFTLSPTGGERTVSGVGDATGSTTWDNLIIGQVYTLTETDAAGWTEGEITCEGMTDLDPNTAGFQFEVSPAQEIACSVSNALDPAAIALSKTAELTQDRNDDQVGQAGDQVIWRFVVTNESSVPLSQIRISDPLLDSLNLTVTCESETLAARGEPGDSTNCASSPYTITRGDVAAHSSLANVATAIGNLPAPPGGGTTPTVESDPADATVPLAPSPDLMLDKTAALVDANVDGVGQVGESVIFTFLVTNRGDVPLANVTVNDPMLTQLQLAITCAETSLGLDASTTCVSEPYSITQADVLNGLILNIATSTGDPDCTVCQPEGEVVSPPDDTVTPTSAQASITIEKSADLNDSNGNSTAQPGETITYRFTVTNTGGVDMGGVWVDDPMLTDLGLTITCEATNLPIGAATNCVAEPYTVTEADMASDVVLNVATAVADIALCSEGCEPIRSSPDEVDTPTGQAVIESPSPTPTLTPDPPAPVPGTTPPEEPPVAARPPLPQTDSLWSGSVLGTWALLLPGLAWYGFRRRPGRRR